MTRLVTFGKRRIRRMRKSMPRGRKPIRNRSFIPRRELFIRRGKRSLRPIRPLRKRTFKRFRNPFLLYWHLKRETLPRPLFRQITRSWEKKQTEWSPIKRTMKYSDSWRPKSFTSPRKKRASVKRGFGLKTISPQSFGETMFRTNNVRQSREDVIKRLLQAKKKKNPNMIRKHPWTGKNKYGPVGHLGPELILDLKPTASFYKMVNKKQSYIKRAVKTAIDDFRDKLIEYGERLIYTYAPEETGRLRKSLLKSIKMGRRVHLSLKMKIFTSRDRILKYAKPVNEMTDKMLQHPRINRNKTVTQIMSRRTGGLLSDPKAQHHFFGWIYLNLKEKAKKLLVDMVKQIVIMTQKASPASIRRYRGSYSLPHRPRNKQKPKVVIDIGVKTRLHDIETMKGHIKENINFPDIVEGEGGLKGVLIAMEKELEKYKGSLRPPTDYNRIRSWFTVKGLGKW